MIKNWLHKPAPKKVVPLTLKMFRELTKNLPEDTEFYIPESDMPGFQQVYAVTVHKVASGMGHIYKWTNYSSDVDRKHAKSLKEGIFFGHG